MKREYIQYVKRLNTIGDLIIEISNLIEERGEQGSLTESIKKYKYANESLAEVKIPEIINQEHIKLVTALDECISVTEKLNYVQNESEKRQAISLQKQKEINIETITKEIGNKLIEAPK